MQKAFDDNQVAVQQKMLPLGATDATSFAIKQLPAVSIIGLRTDKLDPTYHTRLDTIENLDIAGLDCMKKVLVSFIKDWDADYQ